MSEMMTENLLSEPDPPPYEDTTKPSRGETNVTVEETVKAEESLGQPGHLDPPHKTQILRIPLIVWLRILSVVQVISYIILYSLWTTHNVNTRRRTNYVSHQPVVGIYPVVYIVFTALVLIFSKTVIKFKDIPPWRSVFSDIEDLPFVVFTSCFVTIIWSLIYFESYFIVFLITLFAFFSYIFTSIAASYLVTGYCWLSRKGTIGVAPEALQNSETPEFFYWHRLFIPKKDKTVNEKLRLILAVNCMIPSWIFIIGQVIYWHNIDPSLVFIWLIVLSIRVFELKFFIGKRKKAFLYSMLVVSLLSLAVAAFLYATGEARSMYDSSRLYGGGTFLVTSIISAPLAALDVAFFVKFKKDTNEGNSNIAQLLFK